MKVLETKNGGYYTQTNESNIRNIILSNKIYLAINDSEENWKLITKEEGDSIKLSQKTLESINSIEDLDRIINGVKIVPMIINEIPMTDNEALARKIYYPQWNKFIGKNLHENFKVVYEDKLYKVRQEHIVQEIFPPSQDTASLYEEINETHAGTKEDPIPYNNNMRLELGKFYTQNGKIYECIRDTGQPVYDDLSKLEEYQFVKEIII